jgi:uncharacterized protein
MLETEVKCTTIKQQLEREGGLPMEFREELQKLAKEYGGEYGLNHSLRLLAIINTIGAGSTYDRDVVYTAVLMHDWGGYAPWKQDGVDHAVRSAEVAKTYLQDKINDQGSIDHIIECILTHHDGNREKSLEAQLISDADGIDFLGAIGIAREFTSKPRELKKAYDSALARMEKIRRNTCLDVSKQIVSERIAFMQEFFERFIEETDALF